MESSSANGVTSTAANAVENKALRSVPRRLVQRPKRKPGNSDGETNEERVYSPQSPKALDNGGSEATENGVDGLEQFVLAGDSRGTGEVEVREVPKDEGDSPVSVMETEMDGQEANLEEDEIKMTENGEMEESTRKVLTGSNQKVGEGKRKSTIDLLRRMFSRGVGDREGRERGKRKGKNMTIGGEQAEDKDEEPPQADANGEASGGAWQSVVAHQGIEDIDDGEDAVVTGGALITIGGRRKRDFLRNVLACISPKRGLTYDPWADFALKIPTMEPDYLPEAPLLQPAPPNLQEKITLVLDLDETLVHSSFVPMQDPDFTIPLEMEGQTHTVYVRKRPNVDKFLKSVSKWYEVIVFTASLSLYANPVMDMLDPEGLVHFRLYREHCALYGECYVKDIAKLGRDLKRTIIIDNSPLSYVLQPENAFPINGFTDDMSDRELDKILGLLEKARELRDVRDAFS